MACYCVLSIGYIDTFSIPNKIRPLVVKSDFFVPSQSNMAKYDEI
jgi:hypothetical protein